MDIVSMALPKYGPYIGYHFLKKPNFMCEHLASFRKGYLLYIYQVSLRSMLRNRIIIWFEKPGFSFFRTSKCTLWAKNGWIGLAHSSSEEERVPRSASTHFLIWSFPKLGLLLKLFWPDQFNLIWGKQVKDRLCRPFQTVFPYHKGEIRLWHSPKHTEESLPAIKEGFYYEAYESASGELKGRFLFYFRGWAGNG